MKSSDEIKVEETYVGIKVELQGYLGVRRVLHRRTPSLPGIVYYSEVIADRLLKEDYPRERRAYAKVAGRWIAMNPLKANPRSFKLDSIEHKACEALCRA